MGYQLHTVDVRTAYLNAPVEEDIDIWMRPPPGFAVVVKNGELKLELMQHGMQRGKEPAHFIPRPPP